MLNVTKTNRIKYLFNLQRTEKFTHTKNIRSLIYSIIFKTIAVGFSSVAISILLTLFQNISAFPLTNNVLGMFIMLFCAFSFFSAFSTINNYLYKASDNEFLFALPVSNSEVYLSKIIIVCVQEFISSLVFLLPILIGFGIALKTGSIFAMTLSVNYYIASALMIVFLPFLPITLALLTSVLYRVFVDFISKYTITIVLVASVLIVAFMLVINEIANIFIANFNLFDQVFYLATKITEAINSIIGSTFIFGFIAQIFTGAYLNFLYYILIVAGMFTISYFAIMPFYFNLVLSPSKRTQAKSLRKSKYFKQSIYVSIIKKEFTTLFSNMSNFFDFFAISVIAPIFVLIINKIFNALDLSQSGMNLVLGSNFLIVSIFIMMGSLYVLNSISSEGKNFYIQQISPVSFLKHTLVKIFTNFAILEFFLMMCCVIISTSTKLDFLQGFGLFCAISILQLGHLFYCYRLEVSHPLLDWHDSAELKQNKNISKGMLNAILVGGLYGAFAIKFFYISAPTNAWIYLFIIAISYLVYQFCILKYRYAFYVSNLNK